MQILDQAVATIRKQGGKGGMDGAKVAARIEAIAALGEQAARLWQDYLDKPGAPGDKYTLVSWIGADRARRLHELSLKAHPLVTEACAAAGDQARFLVLDESPIVLAYAGLQDGETGPQAAGQRLAAQQAMNRHLLELAGQVRTVKASAAKPAGKKPAAKAAKQAAPKKKAAARKPVKKAAKKPPKKK